MNTFVADFVICKVVTATDVPVSIGYLESLHYKDHSKCCRSASGGCDEMFCPCIGTLTKCRLSFGQLTCTIIVTRA